MCLKYTNSAEIMLILYINSEIIDSRVLFKEVGMYVKRDMEKDILRHLDSANDQFILLSGARQTGKSSILENIKTDREKLIINLWDESQNTKLIKSAATFEQFEFFLNSAYGFRPDNSKILIIDEAQAGDNLGKFIMQMHRVWKNQRVIFSGSILSRLFRDNIPMPTGRVIEFILRPLNFVEFLRFRNKESYLELISQISEPVQKEIHELLMSEFELFLSVGGLPGVVRAFENKGDYLVLFESLVNNFYRDADRFLNEEGVERSRTVQYGSLLEHCLKTIGRHVAFPTTNSTILSTDSPAYRVVLPKLLEALRSWHLVYTLEYETVQNTTKKGYSSKKYLFDTGIMNFLLTRGMSVTLAGSETSAQLFENMVCQELVSYAGSARAVTSFKNNNKSSSELDFVVRTGRNIIPIEVKSGTKITDKSLFQMIEFLRTNGLKKGFVVYNGTVKIKKIDQFEIVFIPPYLLHRII